MRAAVEEGIVAGGGTALINVAPEVEKVINTLKEDEKLGAKIVLTALEEPIKQIAKINNITTTILFFLDDNTYLFAFIFAAISAVAVNNTSVEELIAVSQES